MNRTLKAYGLGVLVVLIWGLIGYRIYAHLATEPFVPAAQKIQKVNEIVREGETQLLLNYEDPFLKSAERVKVTVPRQATKTPIALKPILVVPWEQIVYFGTMLNNTRKKKIATVRVNGVEYFVNEGDEIAGFKFGSLSKDSVKVTYSGQSKILYKIK